MFGRTLLVLAGVAVLLVPQAQAQAASSDRASVAAVEMLWRQMTGYITQVAKETPEAGYSYRPVESVRTTGEMIGHVAGAQNMMCAAVLGDPPQAEDAVELSATSKAALIAALEASTAYCARAYALTDQALQGEITLFGQTQTGFAALVLNATHNGEHYGNLITYLRIQGIVPPSSRPPGGN